MNFDPIQREAGTVTLQAVRRLALKIAQIEHRLALVIQGGQLSPRITQAINVASGDVVFVADTAPTVPTTGAAWWLNTSTDPHSMWTALTNSGGGREWTHVVTGRDL